MRDAIDRNALLERLGAFDAPLWKILDDLAGYSEEQRRITLRAHDEAGFNFLDEDDQRTLAQRRDLDRALGALTLVEIACQTGYLDDPRITGPNWDSVETLLGSEAFFRYVDVYLFFAVRMLAGRLFPPPWWGRDAGALDLGERERNQRSFPLAYPPAVDATSEFSAPLMAFLDLGLTPEEATALRFLDDLFLVQESTGKYDCQEPMHYELWLRGLNPQIDAGEVAHFERITAGLLSWSRKRTAFYLSRGGGKVLTANPAGITEDTQVATDWVVTNPFAARFALADIYWLARLLRADIASTGRVTYERNSWPHLLRFRKTLEKAQGVAPEIANEARPNPEHEARTQRLIDDLWQFEDVLRSVFGFVCDLVQNAVELTDERECRFFEPQDYISPPAANRQWREVFDEELKEIGYQRTIRAYKVTPSWREEEPPFSAGQVGAGPEAGWSRHFKTGKEVSHRIGLAFSGGGIRSATFNLGVLQGLQEFDLLRQVDYLSCVSGGGFIGSWLVGNVKRTRNWLAMDTAWDESIRHLRSYSNYLAPLTGIFSADTWTMGASWVRNAFLIQITSLTWLWTLLLVALGALKVFNALVHGYSALDQPAPVCGAPLHFVISTHVSLPTVLCFLTGLMVTPTLMYNLAGDRTKTGKQASKTTLLRRLAILPAWIGAFLLAAILWSMCLKNASLFDCVQPAEARFSQILLHAFYVLPALLSFNLLAFFCLGCASLMQPVKAAAAQAKNKWVTLATVVSRAAAVAVFCIAVFYLQVCAVLYLFLHTAHHSQHFGTLAFVSGPALLLIAFTVSVVIFIGLTGRATNESQREWWTRFGAWLTIYALLGLAWSGIAVFGPWAILKFAASKHPIPIKTATVAGWIGTIISGLFAGKSSKTAGDGTKSPWLELLAKLGGFLFIAGTVVLAATVLHLFLRNFVPDAYASTSYWFNLLYIPRGVIELSLLVVVICGLVFSFCFEINIFGLNQFYRNRLVRCYLGATRWTPGIRKPHPFTGFDFKDDIPLSDLNGDFRGPFPIFNCTLNLAGSSDLALNTRHSASFMLTPRRCGSDRPKVGYAPTGKYAYTGGSGFADNVMLGQAVSISGAAASPNMGYNTSPLVSFLLTMFNVRLGWWFPNPGQALWDSRGMGLSLYYLTRELLGMADETRNFLNVSDGGHFENLGIYELVRRRCQVIIASDAECDEQLQFGGLGNVIRICETDFGAIIDIDVKSIRQQKEGSSLAHCAVGTIKYSNGELGYLIYLKASVSGDESVDITQYRSSHPTFPHETTADQFFSEDQFESYRKLGQHVVEHSMRGTRPGDHPLQVAKRLADVLVPAGCPSEAFVKHTQRLNEMWETFRGSPVLHSFLDELMAITPPVAYRAPANEPISRHQSSEELCVGLELLQLMEDVFMDLRLDDFWEHPDNRGWAIMFMRWARSPRFQSIWRQTKRTYGIRFEYFCSARLGLIRDNPIARV